VTYYDDVGIDVTTLGTGDLTVSGPFGFTATPTFISVDVNTNGSPRVATYSFTPPGGSWDWPDDGAYTVSLNANEVVDADSPTKHAVPAAVLAGFTVGIPATYVVDLAIDEDDGDYSAGDLSLREAIELANVNLTPGADTITFDPVAFGSAKTLTLTLGELFIRDALTIAGPAARRVRSHTSVISRCGETGTEMRFSSSFACNWERKSRRSVYFIFFYDFFALNAPAEHF